jgi:pimeloyl-ACP methyl ester carboxylesterase
MLVLLIVLCLTPKLVGADQHKSGDLGLEPYLFETQDGHKVEAELGHLFVPENRSNWHSKLIQLAFVRFKSTAKNPGTPTLYLVGGPGGSAISQARGVGFPLYMALREAGDFILLDQRGTGMSKPNLTCREKLNYPVDKPLEREELLSLYLEQSRACAQYWRSQGVDLSAYNTNENADDVEALRKALNIPKLSIFGTSYGTHLSLAVIRRHGENLYRVVIAGIEGPDHTYKLPSNVQSNLEQVAQIYKADPNIGKAIPDFLGLMQTLLDRLERQPVAVELTDPETKQKIKVTVGKFDLQFLIANFLPGRVSAMKRFPAVALAMSKGDFSFLAQVSFSARRDSIGSAMSFVMDCASGVSRERWAQIKREETSRMVGSLIDFPFPEICEAWGNPDLGSTFRSPVSSKLPVLFISGTLDGRTPISNADEVRRRFPNSVHLIVEQAGHVDASMFKPKTVEVMLEFLKVHPVSTTRVASPPLEFPTLNF